MTDWERPALTPRLFAGSFAMAATLAILATLLGHPVALAPKAETVRVSLLLLRAAPAPVRSQAAAAAARRPEPSARVSRAAVATRERPALPVSPVQETVVQAPEAAPPRARAEPLPASAPLQLDRRTIERALAGTEGKVRGLARNAGAELDSPRMNRSEQLSAAIAQTAVPDCLAPNAGGSLLSIPIIVYMAIEAKCK